MSANSVYISGIGTVSLVEQRILRYTLGATLAMALALGLDWQFAYLTPVLVLNMLGSSAPPPSYKTGGVFVLVIAITGWLALLVARTLLPYPPIFLTVMGLLLFHVYYFKSVLPGFVTLWLFLNLLILPMVELVLPDGGAAVLKYLMISGIMSLLVVWIAHFVFPERSPSRAPKSGAPSLPPGVRFSQALEATLVVFPVMVLFYFFRWVEALLILIFIGILSMQPGFARDFKGGKALLLGNLIGGVVAILEYEILTMVPEFYFLLLLTLLLGLFFGIRLFSGKPTAPLFGMAFSTVLLVIGSETSRFAGDAGSKVYTRIVQLAVAVVYVVVAFGLLEYFKKQGKKYAKSL